MAMKIHMLIPLSDKSFVGCLEISVHCLAIKSRLVYELLKDYNFNSQLALQR